MPTTRPLAAQYDLPTVKTVCPPVAEARVRRVRDLAPRQVLALAIDLEHANAARFELLATHWAPEGGFLHALLLKCRDEERAHAATLEQAWAVRFGDLTMPIVRGIDVEEVSEAVTLATMDGESVGALTMEEVLEILRRAEEAAAHFYDRAAAAATDRALRTVFEELAGWEREHANGVTNLRELARASGASELLGH